jgi:hypothetical protein
MTIPFCAAPPIYNIKKNLIQYHSELEEFHAKKVDLPVFLKASPIKTTAKLCKI